MKASSGGKEKSKALNMVIKLAAVNDKPCVKISDELTKACTYILPIDLILMIPQNTGDPEVVKLVKEIYNLPV